MAIHTSIRCSPVAHFENPACAASCGVTGRARCCGMLICQREFGTVMIESNPFPLRGDVAGFTPSIGVYLKLLRVDVLVAVPAGDAALPDKLPLPRSLDCLHAMTRAAHDRLVAPSQGEPRLGMCLDSEGRRRVAPHGVARLACTAIRSPRKLAPMSVGMTIGAPGELFHPEIERPLPERIGKGRMALLAQDRLVLPPQGVLALVM